jgi:alpha-L-arabinofuranosidase
MRACVIVIALLSCFALVPASICQQPTLTIQVDHPTATVSPTLYGLMTEEINYSYDGGIYAELIRDRIGRFGLGRAHWPDGCARRLHVNVSIRRNHRPQRHAHAQPASPSPRHTPARLPELRTTAIGASPCARTPCTRIVLRQDRHAGPSRHRDAPERSDRRVAASATVTGLTKRMEAVHLHAQDWRTCRFRRTTISSSPSRSRPRSGSISFSLFPPTYHDRPGGNRTDIMNLLAAMQPKFLRLPGGNYLEGDHIAERFDWKKTIGPWSTAPRTRAPGAIARPTAWACSSFSSGAKT